MSSSVDDFSSIAPATVQKRTTPRVAWVDIAKGVGIILVVYGHVSGGLVDAGVQQVGSVANAASALIYTFHMPLFFFLSGIWLSRAAAKPFSQFIWERLGTIVYPYLLWSSIQLIANRAMSRFTNASPETFGFLSILYRPYAQFWFLFALFPLLLVVTLLLKLRHGAFVALTLGVIAYAAYPSAQSLSWTPAAQILRFFVYVAAGAAVGPWLVRSGVPFLTRIEGWGLAAVCIVLLWIGFWRSTPSGPIESAIASICGMTAVIAASWSISGTLLSGVLEFLGKRSLEIYIAHVLGAAGMRIALIQLGGVYNPVVHFTLGVGAGIAFPLGLWWLASRSGFGFIFSLRPRGASQRQAVQSVSTGVMPA